MPIKGLTDLTASFPRIGELRKGAPKPEKGWGADLNYFRFTSEVPGVEMSFQQIYGESPQALDVYLPYATADDNFECWVEEWKAGGLMWRGDGENMVIWRTPQGTYSQEIKPMPANHNGKQVGRLKVILPKLGRMAYIVALTSSVHDIMELTANLRAYQALRGSLQGIPFILRRVPRTISTPDPKEAGKRLRREKWLLNIEAAPEWVSAQLGVMRREALPDYSGDIVDAEDEPLMIAPPEVVTQPPPPAEAPAPKLPTTAAELLHYANSLFGVDTGYDTLKKAAKARGINTQGELKEATPIDIKLITDELLEMYAAGNEPAPAE